MSITRSTAEALDAADPLADARQRFYISDPSVIYFDGNSLGRLPAHTPERIADVVERQWGQQLIRSWSQGWMDLPVVIGDHLGQTVLGAEPGETIVCDNVTVNIKKLMYSAQAMRLDRPDIIAHRGDFPTDRYLAEHQAKARGGDRKSVV